MVGLYKYEKGEKTDLILGHQLSLRLNMRLGCRRRSCDGLLIQNLVQS